MNDKEKIEKIMLDKHLNNTQFSDKVGITPGTLSHIISGRTKPTLNILRSIKFVFPDINPSWLFFDEGSMYISENPSTPSDEDGGSSMVDGDEPEDADSFGVFQPDLFAQQLGGADTTRSSSPRSGGQTREPLGQRTPISAVPQSVANISEVVEQTVKQLQRPQRKVVEVRIFFDDGTFETFCNK